MFSLYFGSKALNIQYITALGITDVLSQQIQNFKQIVNNEKIIIEQLFLFLHILYICV